jgi:hypothetical protein
LVRFRVRALQGLLIAMVGALPGPAAPADRDQQSAAALTGGKTGKERLAEKGSDEQRVDDCKVPPAQRTRVRPTDCLRR